VATKFVVNSDANNKVILAIFSISSTVELFHATSLKRVIKKKSSIKNITKNKFNGVDFLKTLVIIRIFYTFVLKYMIYVSLFGLSSMHYIKWSIFFSLQQINKTK
jgi:hypothetical protein